MNVQIWYCEVRTEQWTYVIDSFLSLGINKKCNEIDRIMPRAAAETRDTRNKNDVKESQSITTAIRE
jgi:hypothetical protein